MIGDFVFTVAILGWIALLAAFHAAIPQMEWKAPTLLVGLLAILLFNVIPAFRPPKASTNHDQPAKD